MTISKFKRIGCGMRYKDFKCEDTSADLDVLYAARMVNWEKKLESRERIRRKQGQLGRKGKQQYCTV